VPYVVETAFGIDPKASRTRRIITGVNWSVALGNPFRSFGRFAESLDSLLTEQRSGHFEPVHLHRGLRARPPAPRARSDASHFRPRWR
jgi:hypothetical protein